MKHRCPCHPLSLIVPVLSDVVGPKPHVDFLILGGPVLTQQEVVPKQLPSNVAREVRGATAHATGD